MAPLSRALSIGLVLPFGELAESFFPDALLATLAADARAAGHRVALVRVFWDGHDDAADAMISARLGAWLAAHEVDLVVAERWLDLAPIRAHLAAAPGRRAVAIARDPLDPCALQGVVELVVGGDPGRTRSGATLRSPTLDELRLAFARVVAAIADGGDPAEVPGVARVEAGELSLRRPIERPAAPLPFDAVVEMDAIAEGAPPPVTRKTLFGDAGCPYAQDPLAQPFYAGVRLPDDRPVARLGCAFCSMGGDYEKSAETTVVARTLEQAQLWLARAPTVRELVLADQGATRYLRALMEGARARGLRPATWLFAVRADAFVRSLDAIRGAARAAAEAGQRLEAYLTGFESFSDAELARYNKGTTAAEQVAAIAAMRALAAEMPQAFGYASAKGHSLILWSPWTTLADLRDSVAILRREGVAELFHELGRNRLRLYPTLPIHWAAARDGALVDAWEDGDEGAARGKGYNAERPWRFLDPRTRRARALAEALRARLGAETELGQLQAAIELAASDGPRSVDVVLADLDALDAALASLQRASEHGALVRAAGACNNGCRACAEGDFWVDPSPSAILARIESARASGGAVVLAGREPTLWPGFVDAVRAAAGDDRRAVSVVTNGRRFASSAFAREVVAAGLSHASVKLFAAEAEAHDAIARDPGAFAQALAGARNLRAAGLRALEARAVLHAEGLAALSSLPARARAAGATVLRVEAKVDAIGLARLRDAASAIEDLATAARAAGLPIAARRLPSASRSLTSPA